MPYQVTYRRTSRLSMRIVKNGDVHVSAPIGMPREKVMAFIEEHRDWIDQASKKTYERQKQRAEFFGKLPLATVAMFVVGLLCHTKLFTERFHRIGPGVFKSMPYN